MSIGSRLLLLCLVGTLTGWAGGLRADLASARELEVRAALLFSLA